MRPVLLFVVWLGLSLLPARGFSADEATLSAADRDAIRQVITQQLEAFQRDDAVEAFSYASPSIQAQFETPAAFITMVRDAYEPVYRPRSTLFLEPMVVSGQVAQPVQVVGPDEELRVAYYLMERQPDGTWRIAGCMLGKPQGQAA
jgi:ketosteroid isomerase-like protein